MGTKIAYYRLMAIKYENLRDRAKNKLDYNLYNAEYHFYCTRLEIAVHHSI